jgi:hypothetical protein
MKLSNSAASKKRIVNGTGNKHDQNAIADNKKTK